MTTGASLDLARAEMDAVRVRTRESLVPRVFPFYFGHFEKGGRMLSNARQAVFPSLTNSKSIKPAVWNPLLIYFCRSRV